MASSSGVGGTNQDRKVSRMSNKDLLID